MSPVLEVVVRSPPPTWARLLADRIHEAIGRSDAIRAVPAIDEAMEHLAWLSKRDVERLLELLRPEARRMVSEVIRSRGPARPWREPIG